MYEVFCLVFNGHSGRVKSEEVGVINAEGPPVPIPNTEVKLCRAENTQLETAREDRYTPTQSGKPNGFPFCISQSSGMHLGDSSKTKLGHKSGISRI